MCVSTVFSGSLAGKPTVVDEDQGYGKRYGNSNGIGPPAVYLRGGAANHAENVRARALTQSKNTVKNSDHKSIVEVSIRSFPTNRFHLRPETVETVETVDFKTATLMRMDDTVQCSALRLWADSAYRAGSSRQGHHVCKHDL